MCLACTSPLEKKAEIEVVRRGHCCTFDKNYMDVKKHWKEYGLCNKKYMFSSSLCLYQAPQTLLTLSLRFKHLVETKLVYPQRHLRISIHPSTIHNSQVIKSAWVFHQQNRKENCRAGCEPNKEK